MKDGYRFSTPGGDGDPEIRKEVFEVFQRVMQAVEGSKWDIGMSAIQSVAMQLLAQHPRPSEQLLVVIGSLIDGLRTLQETAEALESAAPPSKAPS